MMMTEDNKFERLLNVLRGSKPHLDNPEEIEEKVIERILQTFKKEEKSSDIFDYLFSWVYVGWVRKSLISASVLILIVFGYQQMMIIRQINSLTDKMIVNGNMVTAGTMDAISDKLLLYKITEKRSHERVLRITERQMKKLFEEINELQLKYDDLIKVIEANPDLKKYLDEKLTENNKNRIKL